MQDATGSRRARNGVEECALRYTTEEISLYELLEADCLKPNPHSGRPSIQSQEEKDRLVAAVKNGRNYQ
jgi:hypothetical protein